MTASKNTSLIKNTAILYLRTLLVLFLGLFSTRLAVSFLGNENFGIANVVYSVVALSYFLHSSLTAASQRYLSVAVGQKDPAQLKDVLKNSLLLHYIVAFCATVLLETVGLYFVGKELNIPAGQKNEALIVYHAWVIVSCLAILQIPWQSLLIAYEKMNLFAFVTVLEITVKVLFLSLVFLLDANKLILYAAIISSTALLVFIVYYAVGKMQICKEFPTAGKFDKGILLSMLRFSSWHLLGGAAFYFMFQGGNILINIFFGTLVNAAMGIAFQVYGALSAFSGNIRQALEPRIVKHFASEEKNSMVSMTFVGARYTFYLLFIFIFPALFDIKTALDLWLGSPPPQAVSFCCLIMIFILVHSFDLSFASIFKATGQVRENQVCSALVYLLTLPVTYAAFKFQMPAASIFLIQIAGAFIVGFIVKITLMSKILDISVKYFFQHLLVPLFNTLLPCGIFTTVVILFLPPGLLRAAIHCAVLIITMAFACFCFDMDKKHRQMVLGKLKEISNKFHHNRIDA